MNDADVVADASAILAALKNEPFSKVDPQRLVGATISTVNLCEVLERLCSGGLKELQAEAAVSAIDLHVVAFDLPQARLGAYLRPLARGAGLSLGDRAMPGPGIAPGIPGGDRRPGLGKPRYRRRNRGDPVIGCEPPHGEVKSGIHARFRREQNTSGNDRTGYRRLPYVRRRTTLLPWPTNRPPSNSSPASSSGCSTKWAQCATKWARCATTCRVLTAMVMRLDGTVGLVLTELRADAQPASAPRRTACARLVEQQRGAEVIGAPPSPSSRQAQPGSRTISPATGPLQACEIELGARISAVPGTYPTTIASMLEANPFRRQ